MKVILIWLRIRLYNNKDFILKINFWIINIFEITLIKWKYLKKLDIFYKINTKIMLIYPIIRSKYIG